MKTLRRFLSQEGSLGQAERNCPPQLPWVRVASMALIATCLIAAPSYGQELAKYTPVPNVSPDTSYIRLFGSYSETATFEIRSFGNKTGREYTTKPITMTVPSLASNQMSFSALNERSIGQGAGSLVPTGEDTAVMLYVKSSLATTTGMFQHVRYTPATGAFDNVSVCQLKKNQDLSDVNRFLMNVHTSRLPSYVSIVGITNPDQVARVVSLYAYDANTGLGLDNFRGYQVTVPANTTMRIPFADIERASGATPAAGQYHVNVQIYAGDALAFTAIASHEVVQLSNNTSTNMTQLCPIVQPVPTSLIGNPMPGPCDLPDENAEVYVRAGSYPVVQEDLPRCAAGGPDFPANRTTPGRVPVNAGADGFINPKGDVDWYKADMIAGRTYQLRLGGRSDSLALFRFPKLTVRDPSGAIVLEDAGYLNEKLNSPLYVDVRFVPTITGTFYLEVSAGQIRGIYNNTDGTDGTTGKYQVGMIELR